MLAVGFAMNKNKANKLAIECIKKEIQRLAVAANLQDKFHADLPHTIEASKKREELKEAIAILQDTQKSSGKKIANPKLSNPKQINLPIRIQ